MKECNGFCNPEKNQHTFLIWGVGNKDFLTDLHKGLHYYTDEDHLKPNGRGSDFCWENSCVSAYSRVRVIEYTDYRNEGPPPECPPNHYEIPLFITVELAE
jgi:hypothetical protein